jgi:hypothetical protein
MIVLGDSLRKSLAKYPFASAKITSWHFGVIPSTVKEILIHELGSRKSVKERFHICSTRLRKTSSVISNRAA